MLGKVDGFFQIFGTKLTFQFQNFGNRIKHRNCCSNARAGLPDGLLSNQKSQFGKFCRGLAMENLGIFYDHLVYFKAIANILWPFGIFCGNLVYFPRFGILDQEKSGNPV
jgi:hypothetical protein